MLLGHSYSLEWQPTKGCGRRNNGANRFGRARHDDNADPDDDGEHEATVSDEDP